jgi:spermidine synthase
MRSESTDTAATRRLLPLLLVLFAGSGCSALIYEIVWFQMLQLVIGSTAVSLGVLLGTFMGGMCLGSLALPRVISLRWHPLQVYALLELALGTLGIAVLFGIPYLDGVYVSAVGRGLPGILLRGAVCAVCLLPPTILMGATLPAIARWIETSPRGVSWLGFLYGGNIAGAVFGCLLAGFYLLRVHDLATATYVAAGLNAAVALLSIGLSVLVPYRVPTAQPADESAEPQRGLWTVYLTIALSGATALAAEVIWTRLLSLLLGATVYTFSIILAVFLVGLGLGTSVGSALTRGTVRPRVALGVCQLLLAGAIAWTAYTIADSLPYWPIDPYLSTNAWVNFQLDLARCCWAILPATFLWGASFPLAVAAVAARGQDAGRLVGGVYAANTIGAIVGALGASLFLISVLGTQNGQRVLIGISGLAAVMALVPAILSARSSAADDSAGGLAIRLMGAAALVAALVGLTGLLVASVTHVPWGLVAYGRTQAKYVFKDPNEDKYRLVWNDGTSQEIEDLFVGEGMNSSIAVTQLPGGIRQFHVSGKVEASSDRQDMRVQRLLGHMPALIHPKPRSVLIVGCGAGVTAGTFVIHPGIEKIVICEIEPLVPQVVATYFTKENNNVVHDPRVRIVYDDARHFILTTDEKFDIITSDPIHPWVKGSATLYTTEYFELCKRHLNPGGIVTQWVPLYESDVAVVKSELATFFKVFPEGTIWSNEKNSDGYDVVLLGQDGPTRIDVDEVQKRLDRADHEEVTESLREVGYGSSLLLFATYAGQAADLQPWLEDAQINQDRNLRLQYLAGMWLNASQYSFIYAEMRRYRRFPEEVFVGSGERSQLLRLNYARF